jgi:hypothetical protein
MDSRSWHQIKQLLGARKIVEKRSHRVGNSVTAKRIGTSTFVVWLAFAMPLSSAAPARESQTPAPTRAAALKPDMQPLAFFLGEWSCEGEFIASKKPIAAHISTTPDLDGSWIAFRWTDRDPSPFHALELFGYDKTAHQFTNFIHDNFGGVRMFNSPGWEAETFTWTGNALAASAPPSERFVIERKTAKEFVITWETRKTQADWTPGDRLTCKQ